MKIWDTRRLSWLRRVLSLYAAYHTLANHRAIYSFFLWSATFAITRRSLNLWVAEIRPCQPAFQRRRLAPLRNQIKPILILRFVSEFLGDRISTVSTSFPWEKTGFTKKSDTPLYLRSLASSNSILSISAQIALFQWRRRIPAFFQCRVVSELWVAEWRRFGGRYRCCSRRRRKPNVRC